MSTYSSLYHILRLSMKQDIDYSFGAFASQTSVEPWKWANSFIDLFDRRPSVILPHQALDLPVSQGS